MDINTDPGQYINQVLANINDSIGVESAEYYEDDCDSDD